MFFYFMFIDFTYFIREKHGIQADDSILHIASAMDDTKNREKIRQIFKLLVKICVVFVWNFHFSFFS